MQRNAEDPAAKPRGITAFGNGLYRQGEDPRKKRKALGEHHDGSFGVYMDHKIRKLRNQNAALVRSRGRPTGDNLTTVATEATLTTLPPDVTVADASATPQGTTTVAPTAAADDENGTSLLFQGVHVYVDGYTVPSKEEIRSIMLLHGGGFEHYETSQVTHIIATHLATSKLLQYKRMRRPPPVVRPEWIVKSIEAKTVLPVQQFLYRGFGDPTQASVSGSLSISSTAASSAPSPSRSESARTVKDADATNGLSETMGEEDEEDHFSECDGGSDEDNHGVHASQLGPDSVQPDASEVDSVHSRTNSTRDGPSFVRHFFAKSRLHHIGSWRTTFQQRASEFMSKYKGKPFPRESPKSTRRVILHVDMDCFFVSVAVRDKPELQSVPVAVAHSSNSGSSEVSSCNYLARDHGVRAGMFMQSAKELCPNLIVLPYKFDEIEQCSFQIYDIFFSHTPYVQAMSCDEAYLEFGCDVDGVAKAEAIRAEIHEKTRCCASVGISFNILLAKLATREAKPDGLFKIASPIEAEPFLLSLKITDLPGVGYRMGAKVQELGLENVADLRLLSKPELQGHFGKANGEQMFNYVRGHDTRPLSIESNMMRKSVSAVINYGIRFQNTADTTEFMMALAEELSIRLKSLHVRTRCLTLLLKKRRPGAPSEPAKFMGMGKCDSFSKSHVLPDATDSDLILGQIAIDLLRQFHFPPAELRGVGLQATKLTTSIQQTSNRRSGDIFRTWLADDGERAMPTSNKQSTRGGRVRNASVHADTLSQVNMTVLNELPSPLREEILESYHHQHRTSKTEDKNHTSRDNIGKQRSRQHPARPLFTTSEESKASSKSIVCALNDIRFSQVDEGVYHALPLAIRKEVDMYAMKRSGVKNDKQLPISRVPISKTPSTNEQYLCSRPLEIRRDNLPTIESLFCHLDHMSVEYENLSRHACSDVQGSIRASFDAIFSRVLFELESCALDEALRMLRYVRRKCKAICDSHHINAIKDGFNHLLVQVNDELRAQYCGVFSVRLVQPL